MGVIIGAMLWGWWSFLPVFGLITMLAVREYHNLTNTEKHYVQPALPALAGFMMFFGMFIVYSGIGGELLAKVAWGVYALVMLTLFISELYRKQENPLANWANIAMGQVYVAVPFSLLNAIYFGGEDGGVTPLLLLALFVTIWSNDTFAYLFGCTFGKHRLFERISPKKSWEGFFGGMLGAAVSGYVFSLFVPELCLWEWIVFSQIVVVFGTFGDLIESLIKRTLGVKDSGIAIPGHGGWLDRFDSMLFASPAVVCFLYIGDLYFLPEIIL